MKTPPKTGIPTSRVSVARADLGKTASSESQKVGACPPTHMHDKVANEQSGIKFGLRFQLFSFHHGRSGLPACAGGGKSLRWMRRARTAQELRLDSPAEASRLKETFALAGLLLRDLIQITMIQKPCCLVYIHIVVTYVTFLNSNPVGSLQDDAATAGESVQG